MGGTESTVPLPEGTPTAGELVVGDVVAERYEIRERLGAGGMGVVYEAYDRVLEVDVALKVVRDSGEGAVRRLRRETQLAREVTHPNVCRIFDVGEDTHHGKRHVFLTMEHLEGVTLAERLRKGPLEAEEARRVIAEICGGLEAAHRAGIVHRDLKPANVMICGERVVLTDFGVATLFDDSVDAAGADGRRSTTVAGTWNYMAPEQAAGEPATPAVDLYALGIVITELVTGKRPFPSASSVSDVRSHETPDRAVIDRLPENWRAPIEQCLAVAPSARPRNAAELARMLFREGKRRRGVVVVGGAMLAIAAVATTLVLLRGDDMRVIGEPKDSRTAELLATGITKLEAGDLSGATSTLEELVAADPGLARGWSELSSAYRRIGRDADGHSAASRGLGLAYGLPRALVLRLQSQLYLAAHDWPRAIAVLEALATLDPDDLSVGLDLAEARVLAGRAIVADSSLDVLRDKMDPGGAARVELVAARAAQLRGEPENQRMAANAALLAARTAKLPHLEARALYERADAETELGDLPGASKDLDAALVVLAPLDDARMRGLLHREQARVAAYSGDFDRSAGLLEVALKDAQSIGDLPGLAATHTSMAIVARRRGKTEEGAAHTTIALKLNRELRDDGGTSDALSSLAHDALLAGDRARATDYWSEALVLARQIGDQRRNAIALRNLSLVGELDGDIASANRTLAECARIADSTNDRESIAYCRSGLAWFAIEQDRANDAEHEAQILDRLGAGEKALAAMIRAYLRTDTERARGREALVKAADALHTAEDMCGEQDALVRATEVADTRDGASAIGKRVAELVEPCGDEMTEWRAAIAAARGASPAAAVAALEKLLGGSATMITMPIVLDARVTLASALRDAGRVADARKLATQIATDARRMGLSRLARRADQVTP